MRHEIAFLLFGLATVVNAHFQLQFPPPRGVFVEDKEPTFCDGYMSPAANRTQFPLKGGFFSLNSEHPKWTAGVLVSSASNPTSFNNFSQVVPFFQLQGEGAFCMPLDFSANANGTSLTDGQNVTIQIIFDGGDSRLFQCADLTLSNNFQISSSVPCTNATGNSGASPGGSSSTATGPSSPAVTGPTSPTPSSSGIKNIVTSLAIVLSTCSVIVLLS